MSHTLPPSPTQDRPSSADAPRWPPYSYQSVTGQPDEQRLPFTFDFGTGFTDFDLQRHGGSDNSLLEPAASDFYHYQGEQYGESGGTSDDASSLDSPGSVHPSVRLQSCVPQVDDRLQGLVAPRDLLLQELHADGTPKRPMNAFMIYARHRRTTLLKEQPDLKTGPLSQELSREWRSLPPIKKSFYLDQAKILKERFHQRHPDYVYRRRPNKQIRKGARASMKPSMYRSSGSSRGSSTDSSDSLRSSFSSAGSPTMSPHSWPDGSHTFASPAAQFERVQQQQAMKMQDIAVPTPPSLLAVSQEEPRSNVLARPVAPYFGSSPPEPTVHCYGSSASLNSPNNGVKSYSLSESPSYPSPQRVRSSSTAPGRYPAPNPSPSYERLVQQTETYDRIAQAEEYPCSATADIVYPRSNIEAAYSQKQQDEAQAHPQAQAQVQVCAQARVQAQAQVHVSNQRQQAAEKWAEMHRSAARSQQHDHARTLYQPSCTPPPSAPTTRLPPPSPYSRQPPAIVYQQQMNMAHSGNPSPEPQISQTYNSNHLAYQLAPILPSRHPSEYWQQQQEHHYDA